MTSLKKEFRSVRPLLGTYVEIFLREEQSKSELDLIADGAFQTIFDLEKVFNFHDEDSLITLFNRLPIRGELEVCISFYDCLQLALNFYKNSGGAFNPFVGANDFYNIVNNSISLANASPYDAEIQEDKYLLDSPIVMIKRDHKIFLKKNREIILDFNGVAKGFIVDNAVEFLEKANLSGHVNAGGDVRYFGEIEATPELRLGLYDQPVFRKYESYEKSIATSAPISKLQNSKSKTNYRNEFRSDLPEGFTAVAAAKICTTADAMTKVAMFGTEELIQKCCSVFNSKILIFDRMGQVTQGYGFA